MVAGWYYGRRLIFPLLHERSVRLWRGCRRKGIRTFPAQEARAYFEQTAEDLCMVHIGCRHEHGDCGHGHGQSTKGILNEVEQAAPNDTSME